MRVRIVRYCSIVEGPKENGLPTVAYTEPDSYGFEVFLKSWETVYSNSIPLILEDKTQVKECLSALRKLPNPFELGPKGKKNVVDQ